MPLTVGIIGLPNVGKSTLLNALADAHAEASNYPFCTIDRNQGVVPVPDQRLDRLAEVLKPKKVIPTTIKFVDIAGLVEGAHRGEGLGNKFLHHVREADVLAHVLRCFEDEDVSHVHGSIDPVRDFEVVETELFLADLQRVEQRLEKEKQRLKASKKEEKAILSFLESIRGSLSEGKSVKLEEVPEKFRDVFLELRLLTSKPYLIVLNTGEDDPSGSSGFCREVASKFAGRDVFVLSAKFEDELKAFSVEERDELIEAMKASPGHPELAAKAEEVGAPVATCYINCRMTGTEYRVLATMCSSLGVKVPFTGLAKAEVLSRLKKALARRALVFVVMLDEVDVLVKAHGDNLL